MDNKTLSNEKKVLEAVALLITMYRFQYAEEQLAMKTMQVIHSDGKRSFLHFKYKQRQTELRKCIERAITLSKLCTEERELNMESMADWYNFNVNLGSANVFARMALAMTDRFGDDFVKMQAFVDEFMKQTGGRRRPVDVVSREVFDGFQLRLSGKDKRRMTNERKRRQRLCR